MGWVPWPGICAVPVGLRSPIWIRGILKSVAFSALCARKLAELAKPDVLSEVTVGQRLTINFVVSSGLAKLSRLNFLIPGSLVRVQPGVFFSTTYGSHSILDRRRGTAAGRRHASPSGITWEGWCESLPMLRETALLTIAAMDGEAKSASSE
jgi:hypothetical protein